MAEIYDGTLPKDARILVSGSSGCGKTSLLHQLLINRNGLFPHHFDNIVYCYGVKTHALQQLEEYFKDRITLCEGVPENLLQLCTKGKHSICVLDDLDEESFSSQQVAFAYTRWSHNYGFAIACSSQNLFASGNKRLTLIRNCTTIILFKNYLDYSVPRLVAHRILPTKPQTFLKIFDHVTSHPYGYLAVCGTGPQALQFRTNITAPAQKIFVIE
jgi:hypothetical protein